MDLCGIFLIPGGVVAAGERDRKIDLHPQRNPGGASRLPVHLGMSCSAPGEDRHHRPVATAEHPLKGLVIGEAGLGQPPGWVWIPIRSNSAGGAAEVHLVIEELGNGGIVKGHERLGAVLLDQLTS